MTGALTLGLFLATPLVQAFCVIAFARAPAARDLLNVAAAALTAAFGWRLVDLLWSGAGASLYLSSPLPGAAFAFKAEPLGLVVAVLLASLSLLNAVYAVGFVRATEQKAPARLLAFVALAVASAIGAALSRNLFTFFVCYIALIVTACPPIAHNGASAAARKFLATLLFAAVGLLLPAIVWTYAIAGGLEFRFGGILPASLTPLGADILLVLYAFGLAATALFPLHHWVCEAMEAPIPASGLAHSVALGAIGGLGMLKVTLFVFGAHLVQSLDAARGLLGLALVGACAAVLVALSKDDLKQRLAYSTIAQIALVTACAMLATPAAAFAGAFAIVAHGLSKLSMFFTIGVVEATTGRTKASQMAGLGRRMPWAFSAFAFAALSLAGAPPLAGAWSYLWLIAASSQQGQIWAAILVIAAALVTFAAFGPLAANALFGRAPAYPFQRPDAASAFVIAPTAIAGLVTLLLLAFVDPIARFLGPGLAP
jgi:multicomponent Na+:H+ antiporter subunit D